VRDGSALLRFTRADVAPQITSPASTSVPLSDGSVHFAITADGAPAAAFSLAGAPSWLSIDPATGVLSGTIPANTAGRFGFTIKADNGVGTAATQDFTLEITAPPVVLTPLQPIKGVTDLPVSGTLAAHGGTGAISWSVAGGDLPPGLVLTADGQLAGVPTQAGSFTFTARATDSATPAASSATEPVTVIIAQRVLAISSTTFPSARAGDSYDQTLTAAQSVGKLTWSVASGTLSPGLTVFPIGKLSGTATTAGTYAFTLQVTDATGMTATAGVSVVVAPRVQAVYVTNGANSAVHSFSLTGAPLSALSGASTGLNGTTAVTVGSHVYVASANNQSIREYSATATGDVMPDAVIAGPSTGLASPQALALDGLGRLYVANAAAGSVTVYAPGAAGDAKPIATLAGPHTGLRTPSGVAVDAAGHLWVADQSANSLTEYPAGANGDVAPLATVAGIATRLNGPRGLAVASDGNLLVANTYDNSVTEYSNTLTGNELPIRRIVGTATGLSWPVSIDTDATGNLWVANQFGGVEEFLFPANGNRTPLLTVTSGLAAPSGLAVAR
jgi:sugar lactone lactonase YvrE